MNEASIRKDLGDFSSIICLKSIVIALEEIMGESAARGNLILAGRKRGRSIADNLSLSNTDKPMAEWSAMLREAIGKTGTRLCNIISIEEQNNIIQVLLSDTICSANEAPGSSRQLTFTLGVIQGAVEAITGRAFISVQTGSVLRGQDYDIIEFKDRKK